MQALLCVECMSTVRLCRHLLPYAALLAGTHSRKVP